ncbi:MAG: von Willebrand factor type A domain-containing protein, partial [Bacteroidales bacterium]|nr:von Willebrand factor type A domain-containing protein [Bacteroidales bacterium]
MNKRIFYLAAMAICGGQLLFSACSSDDADSKEAGAPGAPIYNNYYSGESIDASGSMPDFSSPGNRFQEFSENPFLDVEKNAVSTFSVDADGAPFCTMRRYLAN